MHYRFSCCKYSGKWQKLLQRNYWSKQEQQEIEKYFGEHIACNKVPKIKEVQTAQSQSKLEDGVLHNRDSALIQTKIWNKLQAKKRRAK